MAKKNPNLVKEARKFLVDYLKGTTSMARRMYPWKNDWRYVVQHSLRVESYAKEIMAGEGGFGKSDRELVRVTCLLHDIASLEDRRRHERRGAKIVKNWCAKNGLTGAIDVKRLTGMIEGHRRKDGKEKDKGLAVVKDADILDQLGAMSVLMMGHRVDARRYDYYQRVAELLERDEYAFFQTRGRKLSTKTGRKIFEEKLAFVQTFTGHLRAELRGVHNLKGN